MVNIPRILCPIDFSDFARHALQHARVLARWYDSQLTVLHVYGPQEIPPIATEVPGAMVAPPPIDPALIRAQVEKFCEPFTADTPLDIIVTEGLPARVIVRTAEEIDASLLVLSTHGRGGFERFFLGSVAEKVLRSTAVPVMTVPPPVQTPGQALYRRILCPLDFSDASTRALEYALSLAKEADASLVLLHVVEWPATALVVPEATHFSFPDYQQQLQQDARARLNAAIPDEARTWCTPEVQVATGKPYAEILRVAADTGTELIVMGVHGAGAINRWLFGSTTNQVIRQATCPVLTLRG